MQKTRVRKDQHSLYIRTGGYVFRPVPTPSLASQARAWCGRVLTSGFRYANDDTAFGEGEEVKASHRAQTELARIKSISDTGKKEFWYAHGESAEFAGRYRLKNTEDVWNPAPDNR